MIEGDLSEGELSKEKHSQTSIYEVLDIEEEDRSEDSVDSTL